MTAGGVDITVAVESAYHQHFETTSARASVSFVGVDPIEILAFRQGHSDGSSTTSLCSLGMSRYPMIAADSDVISSDGPRAELVLELAGPIDEVWRRLAVLAAAPVVESVVYTVDARIDLGEAWLPGSRCTGAVVARSPMLPVVVGDTAVDLFQVLPASQTELAWARVHGSGELVQRWRAAGTDLTDLRRAPVELD